MYLERSSPNIVSSKITNNSLIKSDNASQFTLKFLNDETGDDFNKAFNNIAHNAISSISPNNSMILADNSAYGTDISGAPRPSSGMIIGPTGYWQMSIGAETELLYGTSSSLDNASAPINTPACKEQCIGVSVGWSLYSGDDVSEQLQNASDALTNSSNEGMKAAGHLINRHIIPYKIYETGTQLPNIEKECDDLCNTSPIDYQLQHGFNE